jgi:hypothetical protein
MRKPLFMFYNAHHRQYHLTETSPQTKEEYLYTIWTPSKVTEAILYGFQAWSTSPAFSCPRAPTLGFLYVPNVILTSVAFHDQYWAIICLYMAYGIMSKKWAHDACLYSQKINRTFHPTQWTAQVIQLL